MNTYFKVRTPPTNRSLGIEIECHILRDLYTEGEYVKFFYSTSDGSIDYRNGYYEIEFVSQPLTPEWLKKEINRLYNKYKWEGNDESCGIHIHASRKWITIKKAERIDKFIRGLEHTDRVKAFGRGSNYYCNYDHDYRNRTRYRPINIQNKETIEFRMFSSGDNKWASYCVDMVKYLIDNANHLNYDAFMAFIELNNPKSV